MIGKQKKIKARKEDVPKKYHIIKAAIAGIVSAILNIGIPLWLIGDIRNGMLFGKVLDPISIDGLAVVLDNILLLSPLMIALAVAGKLFRKGDIRRMVVRSVRGFVKFGWWLFITNMGHIDNVFNLNGIQIDILMTGFFMFILLFAVIRCVIEYCDYKDYREEYMDDCDKIAFHKGELPPERKDKETSREQRIGGRYE